MKKDNIDEIMAMKLFDLLKLTMQKIIENCENMKELKDSLDKMQKEFQKNKQIVRDRKK